MRRRTPLPNGSAAGRTRGRRGRNRPFEMERRHEGASCVGRRAAILRFVPRVQVQGGGGRRRRRSKLGVTSSLGSKVATTSSTTRAGCCTAGAMARKTGREARPARRVVHLLASADKTSRPAEGGVPMRVMEGVIRAWHAGSHDRLRCGGARGRLTAQPTRPMCRVQRSACMLHVLAHARLRTRGRSRKASRSGGYLVSVDSVKKICCNCLSGPSRAGQSGQDALA